MISGHFIVYTADQMRFLIPLAYLNSDIFKKLLEMSKEEFGLPSDGPITLPYRAVFVEYIFFSIGRGSIAGDLQKAWLLSITTTGHCSSSSLCQERRDDQLLVH
ncbi:unnamed protein product [Coffea canephora]|uniref:Auxin-responsive protein n=1 Tax=Coffea canephora TaxID=49390 RepID=A0A068V1S4_COFCA|nr:unnamed protein product [Coffea canephora]